jgi:hypothetical protein
MRIIVISSKQKIDSEGLHVPLNTEGFKDADNLCTNKILDSTIVGKIDAIYSAPSICCLQTIYPYCITQGIKVCIENAFYKKLTPEYFNYNNFRYNIEDIKNHFKYLTNIIDCNYKSSISTSNISFCDNENDFNNRITPFLYSLVKNSKNNEKTYIINTHKCVSDKIKDILTNKYNKKFYANLEIHYL